MTMFAADTAVLTAVITFGAIGIIGAAFAGVAMMRAGRAERNAAQVHHEVRTMNELTLGQLGEADETRRIQEKPPAERTSREKRHIDQSQERSTGA